MQFNQELFDYAAQVAKAGKVLDKVNNLDLPIEFPGRTYDQMRPLVRSAIQKDIRRGNIEGALLWGVYLYQNDVSYAWSTLATVIVEDVGLANPPLLSVVSMATLTGFRIKFDGIALFRGIIAHACAGNKNRSPCEMSVYAEASGANLGNNTEDEDLLHYLTPGEPVQAEDRVNMYLAGVYLRKRSRHGNQALLDASLMAIMGSYDNGADARDAMITFERPIDTMNHGVHAMLYRRGQPNVKALDFPNVQRHKGTGLPLAALDSHTELGRQAIGLFTTYIEPTVVKQFSGYAVSKYKLEKLIGKVIFFEEGALVDKLEDTITESLLRRNQQHAYYRKSTKDTPLINFVRDTVKLNWDTLNKMRLQVL